MTIPLNCDTLLTGLVTGTMSASTMSRMSAGGTLSGVRSSACFHAAFLLERGMTDMEGLYEVEPNTGCWLWTGSYNCGYGALFSGGKNHRAHRMMYERMTGSIPEGMCVLHKCDTPPCVNPKHLFLGTRADNSKDAKQKGRSRGARGEAANNAKLTRRDVLCIRELLSKRQSQRAIARRFNVSRSAVSLISLRKTWGWLP